MNLEGLIIKQNHLENSYIPSFHEFFCIDFPNKPKISAIFANRTANTPSLSTSADLILNIFIQISNLEEQP